MEVYLYPGTCADGLSHKFHCLTRWCGMPSTGTPCRLVLQDCRNPGSKRMSPAVLELACKFCVWFLSRHLSTTNEASQMHGRTSVLQFVRCCMHCLPGEALIWLEGVSAVIASSRLLPLQLQIAAFLKEAPSDPCFAVACDRWAQLCRPAQ